ncbi:MAG: HAMP domain-containing sensor histidine kinase [Ilumatobacteraceae bacterium]
MRGPAGGLRMRSALAFAVLALVLSAALSVSTYQLTRSYLLDQRESLGLRQAILNASATKGLLASGDADPGRAVTSIGTGSGSRAVLRVAGEWYAAAVELDETKIPSGVAENAARGVASQQRVEVNGNPFLVVGVGLPGLDTAYFEFVPLREYQRTLATLLTVLVIAASITTILGAVAGWMASRRVLRPLVGIAVAARAMSGGELSSRLDVGRDPDLRPVATAFNEMASSLERRIAREVRFTADVSHELRTPLTAAGSAINLARRAELSERAALAIGIAGDQIDQLRHLTLELLEISRFDAGVAELNADDTDVVDLSRRVLVDAGADPGLVHSDLGDNVMHRVDRLRYQRVLANLVENADRYAAGVVRVGLSREGSALVVTVDDAGPGVPESERLAIFGRFHRGLTERAPGTPKGSGLGLSLAEEHVALHGGSIRVTDNPDGGARFVAVFP